MACTRLRLLGSAAIVCVSVCFLAISAEPGLAQDQSQATAVKPTLSEEEMRQFLLTAKIIKSEETPKGVTRPRRLTLSDGRLTHDAGFQSIDVKKSIEKFDNGTTELLFQDTYHFNIAAYELAKLLGLESMMPVTVERRFEGKTGSLTWWLNTQMDEGERVRRKIQPPDIPAWNNQMYKKRVFAQLVYDTDPNLTNVLIGENWELYMIDFTRAFRQRTDLANPKDLVRCDRQLLEKLRKLDQTEVELKTKPHLKKEEIKALMARRDKIIAHFDQEIAKRGEAEVLY